MAYLDETEDFRGYSEKSSMEKKNDPDTVAQIGQFFRRSSTRVKQKFEETDFKGGAQNLGKSIADASKRTGAKISKGVKEINVKEKSVKVKTGFMRFATKVKGLFSKSDSGGPNNGEEETKEVKSKDKNIHDKAKAELQGRDTNELENESPVPDMLKLEGHHSSDEFDNHHDQEQEESKDSANVKGSSQVVFFGR